MAGSVQALKGSAPFALPRGPMATFGTPLTGCFRPRPTSFFACLRPKAAGPLPTPLRTRRVRTRMQYRWRNGEADPLPHCSRRRPTLPTTASGPRQTPAFQASQRAAVIEAAAPVLLYTSPCESLCIELLIQGFVLTHRALLTPYQLVGMVVVCMSHASKF